MNKKHLKLAAIAFAVWYVISRPQGAANLVNATLASLDGAADSFSQFLNALP